MADTASASCKLSMTVAMVVWGKPGSPKFVGTAAIPAI